MITREEIERMIVDIADELKTNEGMFRNIPLDRLAHITSGLFSLSTRLSALTPLSTSIPLGRSILLEANSLAKAYNNDKNLKITV